MIESQPIVVTVRSLGSKDYKLTHPIDVIVERAGEFAYFHATAVDVDCSSSGPSTRKAIDMLLEFLVGEYEALKDRELEVPESKERFWISLDETIEEKSK